MFCVVFVFFPYFVGFGRKEVNSINSSSKHMNCAKFLKIWPLCTILAITLSSKLGLRHGQVRWKEDSDTFNWIGNDRPNSFWAKRYDHLKVQIQLIKYFFYNGEKYASFYFFLLTFIFRITKFFVLLLYSLDYI